ncbi:MAG: hypothetical protein HRT57_16585 [Crocinitomicaceae bacterium]|nr:hypothetical protein [Crocinitomicaceae bacterium]
MESIISIDLFDAYRTEDGILINEKGNSAKKFGMVVVVMGMLFFLIGYFVNVEAYVPGWIAFMFSGVFFYGGIVLFALGVLLFIVKGLLAGTPTTTIYKDKKEINLRGKIVPFSEIDEVSLITTPMPMGKIMNAFLLKQNGKRKALIGGSSFHEDTVALGNFIKEVQAMVGVEVYPEP